MNFAPPIEVIFSLLLFVNAALFIPQVVRLLKEKNSKELSLITFLGFCMIQLFTVLHGILHHDTFLVLGYSLSLLSCGAVTLLIIKYRPQKNGLALSESQPLS